MTAFEDGGGGFQPFGGTGVYEWVVPSYVHWVYVIMSGAGNGTYQYLPPRILTRVVGEPGDTWTISVGAAAGGLGGGGLPGEPVQPSALAGFGGGCTEITSAFHGPLGVGGGSPGLPAPIGSPAFALFPPNTLDPPPPAFYNPGSAHPGPFMNPRAPTAADDPGEPGGLREGGQGVGSPGPFAAGGGGGGFGGGAGGGSNGTYPTFNGIPPTYYEDPYDGSVQMGNYGGTLKLPGLDFTIPGDDEPVGPLDFYGVPVYFDSSIQGKVYLRWEPPLAKTWTLGRIGW